MIGETAAGGPGRPRDRRAELDRLLAKNLDRLRSLAAQGVQVQGMGDHYVQAMLEELLGADLWRARLAHERWVDEQLAAAQQQVSRARLLQPPGGRPS